MMADLPVTQASNLVAGGFQHGFFGCGPAPGLPMVARGGASPVRVAESRGRIVRYLGIVPEALHRAQQVHGLGILEVSEGDDRRRWGETEGDALIAREPGVAVGVLTADCAPLLAADSSSGWVAAAHLGRRGALAGLAGAVVGRLLEKGASLEHLRFAVGPHIQAESYEVGEALYQELPTVAQHRDQAGRACCNLRAIIAADLAGHGVRPEQIEWSPADTLSDMGFFSYRRQGDQAGRQLSAIVAGGARG